MMAPRRVLENIGEMIILSTALAIVLSTVESEGGTLLQNRKGHFYSPYYPIFLYPSNYSHIWEIRVPQEYRIKLVFDIFDLQKCNYCDCDYVAVFDGDIDHTLLAVFCGPLINQSVLSTTNVMFVHFLTDSSNEANGFSATYTTELNLKAIVPCETERNLIEYFLNPKQQSHNINKWGVDITRIAVALYLHDPQFFAAGNETGEDLTYGLTLQLMSKFAMRKRISTNDLALYLNALTVACINPQTFFGLNIRAELRKRAFRDNLFNPFLIFVLCSAGENLKKDDLLKLLHLSVPYLRTSRTGNQAMLIMALECISRKSLIKVNDIIFEKLLSKITKKQQKNGAVVNLKTTALVIQALMATGRYETTFNLSMAVKYILKGMENTQLSFEEMYYILPIINGKTLLDISSIHCESFIEADFEEVKNVKPKLPDERVQVQISIIVGDGMDFTRTWRIKIPSNYSFYQALENISSADSHIKIQYTILEGKPFIASVGSYQDSIEKGLFWYIFVKPLSSNDKLILIDESPVDIRVSETDELILWYRSGVVPITQKISTDDPTDITDTTDV